MIDTDAVRRTLAARRAELAERVGRLDKDLHHRAEPPSADFAEQATEQENLEVMQALEAEGRGELARVERSLARLERGEYPVCTRCGGAIGEARLAALPYAETCIGCAD